MKRNLPLSVLRSVCLFVLLKCSPIDLFCQAIYRSSFFEAGITLAPSNFLGDLGGNYGRGTTFLKDNNFPMTRMMTGGYVAFHPFQWLGFRFAGNIGKLEGDDAIINANGGLEEARKTRNSNFRTDLREAFLVAEVYPTVFLEGSLIEMQGKLRPYGIIGAGVFHFNPQGRDPKTGEWIYLRPLRTEGQGFKEYPDRKEYKLTQLNIPMGFGVKYFLSERATISLEVIHRKTFTDYIDDVSKTYYDPSALAAQSSGYLAADMADQSDNQFPYITATGEQRGDPRDKDSYMFAVITINYKLRTGRSAFPMF